MNLIIIIRIVTLVTSERVLCMFGDVRDDQDKTKSMGYSLLYPFTLTLGKANEDGTSNQLYQLVSIQSKRRASYELVSISLVLFFPDESDLPEIS